MNWRLNLNFIFLLTLLAPLSVEAKTVFLQIRDFNFNPNVIEIEAGDTVRWTNMGNMPHTIEGGGMDSGTINTGETFEFTFPEEGTFDYICGLHPSMTGRVVVLPATAAVPEEENIIIDATVEEDLGDLGDFFEVNNPAPEPPENPPAENPEAPIMGSVDNNQDEPAVEYYSAAQGEELTTSGSGGWVIALIVGIVGAFLFLGTRRG